MTTHLKGPTIEATEGQAPDDTHDGRWSFAEEVGPCLFTNNDAADFAFVLVNAYGATNAAHDFVVGPLKTVDISNGGIVKVKTLSGRWYTSAGAATTPAGLGGGDAYQVKGFALSSI